jgi:DnaJ-class molecular chaperone
MGVACSECLGRGYVDEGDPCKKCGSSAEDARKAFDVQVALQKPVNMDTFTYADGPAPADAPPNSAATDAISAGRATAAQVAAQDAKDLEAMKKEGMTRGR